MPGQQNSVCSLVSPKKHFSHTSIVHAFISSKLDLNNALLFGISAGLIKNLQTAQNAAAQIIVHADKYACAKPILKELHWLPIQQRINFKIILLTFKALHGLTATYISELISIKIVSRDFTITKVYSSWNIHITLLLVKELSPILLQNYGTSYPLQSETLII